MINLYNKLIMMKKYFKFLLLGSMLLIMTPVQSVFAQTEESTGVNDATLRIGPKVGMSSSAFAVDNENITDSKKGLIVGGFAQYKLLEFLTLQGELLYQQQGAANVNQQNIDANTTIFQNILQHNIDLPVMAILTVPGYASDSPLIPYFSAGVDYTQNIKTYAINKTKYTYDDGSSYRTSSYTDVSNMYKQNDIGALFGMGFLMKTESWMYTLDIRYRFGLTNINNFRPDNPGNDFTTNVLSVSVGVAIF